MEAANKRRGLVPVKSSRRDPRTRPLPVEATMRHTADDVDGLLHTVLLNPKDEMYGTSPPPPLRLAPPVCTRPRTSPVRIRDGELRKRNHQRPPRPTEEPDMRAAKATTVI